ncbi:MAG TPA: cytochrome c3 family protein [Anaerolineae bacterium]|nr:cytochrome c3 family protein [Anaerolineae bacterium]
MSPYTPSRPSIWAFIICLITVSVVWFTFVPPPLATAMPQPSAVSQTLSPAQLATLHQQQPDTSCRLCHSDTEQSLTFPSGESIPARIDIDALDNSAHGYSAETPLNCQECHRPADNYGIPHTPITAPDVETYHEDLAATCLNCHTSPHLTSHPGPETDTPVTCTACHGAHDITPISAWGAETAVAACLDCHQQNDIDLSSSQLTAIIDDGLFTNDTDNGYCLACHSQPGLTVTFPDGSTRSATIDLNSFHDSVHGTNNDWDELQCTDCHQSQSTYPHEPITAATPRDYTIAQNESCAECHQTYAEETQDSVHALAIEAGNPQAAVCSDCHGAHDTEVPTHLGTVQACQQCHSEIYDEYATSVHGDALITEDNQDVPTCTNCHGVHTIGDPTTDLFRIRSPQLCADCHANDELMTKYDISTEVFDTYVADFHGTTVTLFDHDDPNAATNKAVCYDCHSVHKILPPDHPEAGIKANLLETCQQCHPNATDNFPSSWTSHFRPSLTNNPGVYLVELFYRIIIPITLAFFVFMVGTDIYRRLRLRLAK